MNPTSDKIADALRQLLSALDSEQDALNQISEDEGATDEQQEAIVESFDIVLGSKADARKALAAYDEVAQPEPVAQPAAQRADWMRKAAYDIVHLTLHLDPIYNDQTDEIIETGAEIIAEVYPGEK